MVGQARRKPAGAGLSGRFLVGDAAAPPTGEEESSGVHRPPSTARATARAAPAYRPGPSPSPLPLPLPLPFERRPTIGG